MFGRARYQLRRYQNHRHAAFRCRDGIYEVRDSIAQRRKLGAAGQINRLGKTGIPGHNANSTQNRCPTGRASDSFRSSGTGLRFVVLSGHRSEKSPMSKETPKDDPRRETDWKNTKQTDEPWKGPVEKEQKPGGPPPDLEKWHETNTH